MRACRALRDRPWAVPDKIESKSRFLIPPYIAALCLLYVIGKTNFDDMIDKKKVIFDSSVYEIINEFKKIE